MPLAFNVVDQTQYRVVIVDGDIDIANASELELVCSSASGKRPTIVDLQACPYMDSTGLGALIRASRSRDITLVLRPDCRIYRIFDLTGLLNHFQVVETIDAAVSRHQIIGNERGVS